MLAVDVAELCRHFLASFLSLPVVTLLTACFSLPVGPPLVIVVPQRCCYPSTVFNVHGV